MYNTTPHFIISRSKSEGVSCQAVGQRDTQWIAGLSSMRLAQQHEHNVHNRILSMCITGDDAFSSKDRTGNTRTFLTLTAQTKKQRSRSRRQYRRR